jgi:hypothetical protein
LLLIDSARFRGARNRALTSGSDRRKKHMDISRKLGILVFSGVPAIIGGGIVYGLAGSAIPVIIYELLLYLAVGAIISK